MMKRHGLSFAFVSVLVLSSGLVHAAATDAAAAGAVASALRHDMAKVGVAEFTATDYKPGTVRHVVLLRFRAGLPTAQREKVMSDFEALAHTARRNGKPYVESVETGPQISGEGASHGLQQAFILTFASQGDRNYFIGTPIVTDKRYFDPAHAALKLELKPALAQNGLVSFDFPVTIAR